MNHGLWKKNLSLLLAISLLISCFAGCAKPQKPEEPVTPTKPEVTQPEKEKALEDYTDVMKLSVYQGYNYGGPTNGPATIFAQRMKSDLKVDVDGFIWPAGEDVGQKIGLFASSGKIPDVMQFQKTTPILQSVSQMASAGMLLDVEPFLKNCPNIMKYFNEDIINANRDPKDGKLYMIPGFAVNPDLKSELTVAVNDVFMVRRDLMEQVGIKEFPKTPEALYDMLVAFKGLPEVNGKKMIPYAPLVNGEEIKSHFGGMFGIFQDGYFPVNEAEQRMVALQEKPQYLDYLSYAAKLYRDGLIYSEPYTLQWQEVYNEMTPNGYVGLTNMWPSNIMDRNVAMKTNLPDAEYVPMPLPKAAGVKDANIYPQPTTGASAIVISAKTADPERLFKLLDWMCTDYGWASICWGFPDKGENGAWYMEDGKMVDKGEEYRTEMGNKNARWMQDVVGGWAYGLTGVLKYTQNLVLDTYGEPEHYRQTAKEQYENDLYINTAYDVFLSSPKGEVSTAKQTDIDKIFKESESRIIMTAKDDAEVKVMYEKMLEDAKKSGLTDVQKEDYQLYLQVMEQYGK